MTSFDCIVLGAGPGGYVAAIRAAQLGLKTALIEKEHLGGVCLNWGCIPTKALLKSAEMYNQLHHLEEFGLSASHFSFDIKKVVERSQRVAHQLTSGVHHLVKKNKITLIEGEGKLDGPKKISIQHKDGSSKTIEGKNIIIATGARSRALPGIDVDGTYILTAKEAIAPTSIPKTLLIIGSGAIGSELAAFYHSFGSKVTILEIQDRILPQEDLEISQRAQKAFEAHGLTILTQTSASSFKIANQKVHTLLKTTNGEKPATFDQVILAVGIDGNIENIGLESTNIKTEKGHILTNHLCETDEPGIYAIGDVASAPWLAHKASHEGILCAEKIAGLKVHPIDPKNIPACTYTNPQIASIGLTEQKANELGYDLRIGRFNSVGNGKSIAIGEMEGFIKTIFDKKTGELLGAHMIGAEVTELIQGFSIAKTLETTEEELIHTVFAHPTLSEMMHESVLNAFGRAIHL